MKKSQLKQLIKEVLTKKKSCSCGCNTCENVNNPGVVLNENLFTSSTISKDLQYHIDNKSPLTENTFRYGSKSFLNLWDEARTLYVREIVHVNDLDKEILEETNLGNYGIYEGKKVPLDMPTVNERYSHSSGIDETGLNVRPKDQIHANMLKDALENSGLYAEWNAKEGYFFFPEDQDLYDGLELEIQRLMDENNIQGYIEGVFEESVNEAKNDDKPLNKPKRGGSKAYYVYVKDPKTKKVKKISFGSGGLKAKINNPKARQAFAKRHNCDKKTDKTTAGYWSCRLPRYAKALGIKSSFSGYW